MEIKQCPFCGGKIEIYDKTCGSDFFEYECENGCFSGFGDTEQEIVDCLNNRCMPDIVSDLINDVQNFIENLKIEHKKIRFDFYDAEEHGFFVKSNEQIQKRINDVFEYFKPREINNGNS